MNLDNSYVRLPGEIYADVEPDSVDSPSVLAWNQNRAGDITLTFYGSDANRLAQILSGSVELSGGRPIAMAYSGHQFGYFSPQLGDGRAALLGEVVTDAGERFDIQLKGSGRTPFSRGGDGKYWLGPVIREYILSEAMHHLGIPTTWSKF